MESHKCVVCKKEKPDVKRRINPYKEDVEDLVVWQYLCDECTRNLSDDI